MANLARIIFVVMLALILCCAISSISCQWVDRQLAFMECQPKEIWRDVYCEEKVFYICHTTLRYEVFIRCNKIDDFIVSDNFTWSGYLDEFLGEYDLKLTDYLRCCND